jgi:chromosome segregation ATPase
MSYPTSREVAAEAESHKPAPSEPKLGDLDWLIDQLRVHAAESRRESHPWTARINESAADELTRLQARVAELENEASHLRECLLKTEEKLAEYGPPFTD